MSHCSIAVICVFTGADAAEAMGADPNNVHDFTSKLLHLAWHPQANLIAAAASNSLYMYYA